MATETLPDQEALRYGRRERAFAQMEAYDLDVLVFGRVANMRYLSGVPQLWNVGTRPFGPGCVAVRATRDIYLLSTWDEGVPDEIPRNHLYGITWNPMNLVDVLKRVGAVAGHRRVGTDAMSPLFAQLLPTAFPNAEIVDASAALRAARRIKTREEVDAVRAAVAVAEAGLAAAVAKLRPGISERELDCRVHGLDRVPRRHYAGLPRRRPLYIHRSGCIRRRRNRQRVYRRSRAYLAGRRPGE